MYKTNIIKFLLSILGLLLYIEMLVCSVRERGEGAPKVSLTLSFYDKILLSCLLQP
jgi:hypothetical protein